ncbi:Uncharacterized protein Fot_34136 [Forsythia ovata]|uniref:Uncharacterized protein n=1 Tax=Forsythia ovata TaxID=205694 RepID=A0ABD1SKM7_9LAMI
MQCVGMRKAMWREQLKRWQMGKPTELSETTLVGESATAGLNVVHGKMQYFFDENDRGYLDGFGFIATASCSHCHPEVVKAIANQINNLITELLILPEALASKLPGNLKFFMLHGVGGITKLAPAYLPKVYSSIKKRGGLCIADEVQGGFAHTESHLWSFEAHNVVLDIVTMTKGIGNGIPLGVMVTTPEIAEVLTGRLYNNTLEETLINRSRTSRSEPETSNQLHVKLFSINCSKNNASTIDHDTTRNKEMFIDMINKGNPIEIVAKKNVIKAIKALQKSAAATVLIGLLMMCGPYSALAASGERVGGSSFSLRSSLSSSRSYSVPRMEAGAGFT